MDSPFSGLKILNLSPWFPSLYATLILADLGADVILVENPQESGRVERAQGAESIINRNKRSLTLNLKAKKGREIFCKLISDCDVLLEGFRAGVTKQLGIDYDTLKGINTKMIYCSVPGYAHDSPNRDSPSFNYTLMGICGALAGMTEVNRNIWVADLATGMFTAIGIMAALRSREKVGEGQYIEVPMADSMLACMIMPLGIYFSTGNPPSAHPAIDVYGTADGKAITINVGPQDKFWQKLCSVIGQEQWAGLSRVERVKNVEELDRSLKKVISQKTREEWLKLLSEAEVPCGPVLTLDEVAKEPYISNGLIVEIEDNKGGKVKQIVNPVRFSKTPMKIRKPAPAPGEDTEKILREIGYSANEIRQMRSEKVI